MLTPAEADRIIAESVPTLPAEDCALANAHGRILRAPVAADRDLPPFDRVTMDGFALQSSALAEGRRDFKVRGVQAAGMIPLKVSEPEDCIEVATGAVLPAGADCVVPYEDTQRTDEAVFVAVDKLPGPGTHVHRRASDHPAGSVLLEPGARLSGREIAVAAACGAAVLRVSLLPRVAILATGDELAEVDAPVLSPHQIRRSNDYALRAALVAAGYPRTERLHLRDVKEEIRAALRRVISEFDAVLITGGVSKGKFDFLPGVLAELGVEKRLHGVAQRPGKPFWFGLTPRRTPVFALPGNPASSHVCFRRYVLPAFEQMSGAAPARPEWVVLGEPAHGAPNLHRFVPVRWENAPDGRRVAHAVALNTSGDFSGLVGTDGFVEIAPSATGLESGAPVRFWPW